MIFLFRKLFAKHSMKMRQLTFQTLNYSVLKLWQC